MKFMNMKRFGAVAMAGALALSLSAPAFAASNTTTSIAGGYEDIPIAVTVPTTGTAQINPYGLPVTITKSDDTTAVISNQKITTRPLNIKNNGSVALNVDASLLVIPKGDVAIAAAKGANDKTMKIDLEIIGLNDTTLAVSSEDETLEDKLIDKFVDTATWASATTLAAPAVAKNAATGTAAKSTDTGNTSPMAVLGASTVGEDSVTYGRDSIALFRLTGDLNAEPNDGATPAVDTPWAAADGFTATVTFKFTPAPPSAGDATVTLAIAGTTAAATYNAGTSGLTVVSYSWTSSDTTEATIPATTGTTAQATITKAGTATNGNTSTITVTATLSNGATISGTATYTVS